MPSPWRALKLQDEHANTYNFIIRFTFSPVSYHVELSDLSDIWEEQLDRRKILRRALNDDTSIDPSEDSSQFQILLQKVEASLKGRDNSTLRITTWMPESVHIQLEYPLPAPLQALRWNMHLSRITPSSIRKEILIPVLKNGCMQRKNETKLIDQLKAKDIIISKFLDKFESMGIDLSDIFPQAVVSRTDRRAISRESVAQYVKGFRAFDENEWKIENDSMNIDHFNWAAEIEYTSNFFITTNAAEHTVPIIGIDLVVTSPSSRPAGSFSPRILSTRKVPGADNFQNRESASVKSRNSQIVEDVQMKHEQEPVPFETKAELPNDKFVYDEDDDTTEDEDSTSPSARLQHRIHESIRPAYPNPSDTPVTVNGTPPRRSRLGRIGGLEDLPIQNTGQRPLLTEPHRMQESRQESRGAQNTPPDGRTPASRTPTKKLGRIGGVSTTSVMDTTASPHPINPGRDDHTAVSRSPSPNRNVARGSVSPSPSMIAQLDENSNPKCLAGPDLGSQATHEPESPQSMANRRRADLKRQLELQQHKNGASTVTGVGGLGLRKKRKF